uniref:Phosphotyrosine protein phosphatase I domain-containing protein n=1 Tax=Chromera velia CCMP2878 TaxID=1169474 RepID=A0A0G4GI29_9ALVE|mmetsp:Transcript_28455/g.55728  ORF Transcript_28455/g.55728 Transcript_28455/m.55728 type:complete len:150 (+) Transcript_28455:149-598(+)|eukprot:Cvel_21992.t1-p1 / transcript=Cvel_21992.t1 / gene=Cvel_21992 / organism=Chromera_velia_CCMP2878 / gene_product=Putative low molecular weight, putative / transcript_product=Putative low molecular weight, putative / location=Cvel_scaffold2118:27189-28232(-) / protein_length=149 / sequence_SO=supercontig / SO=protein_coding / is_pseudo=false
MSITSVLFVCLGNVNRSCTAEYVLKARCPQLRSGSAGTGGHFAGDPAMSEMVRACRHRGIDITPHRARKVEGEDFSKFDLIIAMDENNLRDLLAMCPPEYHGKLRLLLRDYAPELGLKDTPDPYYEGGHDRVFECILKGVDGLVKREGF